MNLNTRLERLEQRQAVMGPPSEVTTLVCLPMKDGDDDAGTRSGGPRGVSRDPFAPGVVTIRYDADCGDDPRTMLAEWLARQ